MTTPFKVLFLCTENSARSMIAEALLNARGRGRFRAASAGTAPAPRVNPHTLDVLGKHGIHQSAARPKYIGEVMHESWNLVITVCDNAHQTCPFMPGRVARAHWGLSDPVAIEDVEAARAAFQRTFDTLKERIKMLVALPVDRLTQQGIEQQVLAIAQLVPELQDDGSDPSCPVRIF